MISLLRDELCKIIGAKVVASKERLSFRGVEYDSREIRGGELFIALKGEKTHGHEFLQKAFQSGAALALVEDAGLLEKGPEAERLLYVPDTLKAFWRLASHWRKELAIPVLAITGSVGKTTVKEMAAAILLRHSRGNYSLKSHNNHVGVPYSILRCGREHLWLVLEMGMNHPGELRELSKLAGPNVALINCVTAAHIEFFKSIDEIADAKFEIKDGLLEQGSLLINADDQELIKALARHKLSAQQKVCKFGSASGAQVRILKVEGRGLEGLNMQLEIFGESTQVEMSVAGKHNAQNAAAAVLAAKVLMPDISISQIVSGLENFTAPLMRLNIKHLPDKSKIIDDSYNANPASMRAALELVSELSAQGKRSGLLLGDMLELGEFSERYHKEIGALAASSGAVFVIALGKFAELLLGPSKQRGIPAFRAESIETAVEQVRKFKFDVLLVKASRGVGLDGAVKLLEG